MKSIIDYTNKLKSFFAEKNALSNEVVTRSMLGAHNILVYPYKLNKGSSANIEYTVNTDGTITTNTATSSDSYFNLHQVESIDNLGLKIGETYIISGGLNNDEQLIISFADSNKTSISGSSTASKGTAVSFTVPANAAYATIFIYIRSGKAVSNDVFYPMIRLASDADTTRQPYAKTNVGLTQNVIALSENQLANGAVNLMENKGVTETVGTIAWVVNSDKSVTGNGTSAPSSGDYTFYYIIHDTSDEWLHLKAGVKYKFSCCPSGGSADTYFVQFLYRTGVGEPSLSFGSDTGNGIEFTPSTDVICYVRVVVKKTVTISNKVFKPMLTYGDIPNSDYSHYSYAKSNEELTDAVEITELSSFTSYLGSTITAFFGNLIKRGKIVTINFYWAGSATNVQEIITLPSEYRPSTYRYGSGTVKYNGATNPSVYQITSDGKICQAMTGEACVSGSCSIVYSL